MRAAHNVAERGGARTGSLRNVLAQRLASMSDALVLLMLGDDVGLGKTLEAGLLASELILRRRAKRILVVATKAMLTQFQQEFWTRFSIPLVKLDSAKIKQIRAHIPLNQNPFDQFDKAIVSIDTLKDDEQYRVALEKSWYLIAIDDGARSASRTGSSWKSRSSMAAFPATCGADPVGADLRKAASRWRRVSS